jgi:hypothetical protein
MATEEPAPTPSPRFSAGWEDRAIFRQGLVEAAQGALDRLPGASVYHITLHIPDDFRLLKGHQKVLYTNREDESLDEVCFRLFPNINGGEASVSALRVYGREVEPAYEYRDSLLRVPLPVALQPGQRVDVEMDFELRVARTREADLHYGYGLLGYFEGVLGLDEFYPVIPVYDDEGWNVEIPPPNRGDITYLDASFYLVRVTAPASLTVVASGVRVGHESDGDAQVVTFAAGPARDFYLAASANYIVVSETVGETTVNSYAFTERADEARLALRYAVDALRVYDARLGVYPYTELDVVSAPLRWMGLEYPGLVLVDTSLYEPDESGASAESLAQNWLERTTVHEVAHQWFYNVVGNDQLDEPWLDEALVTYLSGPYYAEMYGDDVAQEYFALRYDRWDSIDRASIPIGLPTRAYTDDEYVPIIYSRGPLFVRALAQEMGQDTFDEFLCDYYESHQWGIGTGDAFKHLAEQHCRCDLTALFEEWVYEEK